MKRQSSEPEVYGAYEAAKVLGVRQTNLRVIRGLPEPYQVLKSGTLYRADEIKALAWERLGKRARRKFNDDPLRRPRTHTPTPLEDAA